MEKKGSVLTQLALISDLFERANMNSDKVTTTLMVQEKEFQRLFKLFSEKAHSNLEIINDTFRVKIGVVDYVFTLNRSSV